MGYKVDFDALDSLYKTMATQAGEWMQSLEDFYNKADVIATSEDITGSGAEGLKSYLQYVHSMLYVSITQAISTHITNLNLYQYDYQSLDSDIHAVFHSDELQEIENSINTYNSDTVSVDDSLRNALTNISDIMYTYLKSSSYVEGTNKQICDKLKNLRQDIEDIEQAHLDVDFTNVQELIDSLTSFIQEKLSHTKSYITNFNTQSLAQDTSYQKIATAFGNVSAEYDEEKLSKMEKANQSNQRRNDILQEEYEERQRKANIIKWVTVGVCAVASIAVTVATAGAGGPLAVAAMSAVTGAATSAVGSVADQWAQTGDMGKIDWTAVGKDAFIGGATGFVTGYIGAGVGGAVTNTLTKAGNSLVNSSSTLVRVGTQFAIGAASNTTTGILSRSAASFINGGTFEDAVKAAFDPKMIAFDVAIGGTFNAVKGIKKPNEPIHKDINESFKDVKAPVGDVDLPSGTWDKGPLERGKIIDDLYNNLGDNYPVVDMIDEDGIVTSVKSRDLACDTYSNGKKLESIMKSDIDKVADFNGKSWGSTSINSSDINGKQLLMVVPDVELNQSQISAINNAVDYGAGKGVDIIIKVGR